MKNILLPFITLTALAFVSCSGIHVIHVTDAALPPEDDGLYYALPRTYITIDVTVVKNEKIPGPYAAFATRFLDADNAVMKPEAQYVLNDIKIGSYAMPDPDHYYFIESGKVTSKKGKNIFLQLSEGVVIQSFNEVADISSSEVPLLKGESSTGFPAETFKYPTNVSIYEKVDTIVEEINLDSVVIEKRTLRKSLAEKPLEVRAREAADFIQKLKENKFNLLTGFQEVNYDPKTIEFMYSQLDKLENEYLALFMGTSRSSTFKYRYVFMPGAGEQDIKSPLFKFSPYQGIIDKGSAAEAVYIQIEHMGNVKKLNSFVSKISSGEKERKGLYYRIPEYAKVLIKQGDEIKAEATFPVAQFGVVTNLPPRIAKIRFHQNTGAINTIELE